MVALFSTLLSNANAEEATTVSSSSIPTVIQLYTGSSPLVLDAKTKVAGHAILSYQAVEVRDSSEEEETLFGRTRKSTSNVVENPNLGVWNAKVLKESALIDALLKIPESPYYCMTVNLTDPSAVEPAMTRMQEALVRCLIENPQKTGNTSLYDLRLTTFGLAPEDEAPSTSAAPDESDRQVHVNLMICAVQPLKKSDDYKETQAQNLVLYHLRRFATAVGATLVYCRTSNNAMGDKPSPEEEDKDENTEEQATLTLQQLANVLLEYAQGNELEENAAVVAPESNKDLIETVMLSNANCPGNWDASKDSLWKALPPTSSVEKKEQKNPRTTGDDGWLQQLRDSLGTAAEPAAAASAPAAPKAEDAEVSSFFENLLKK